MPETFGPGTDLAGPRWLELYGGSLLYLCFPANLPLEAIINAIDRVTTGSNFGRVVLRTR